MTKTSNNTRTKAIQHVSNEHPYPPGYKQTEVGVIPKDWKLVSYGNVFEFLSTATYSRKQLTDTGDIGYVHYGDIHMKWGHLLDLSKEKLPYISREKLKGYSLVNEGDLIIADASEDYDGIGASVEVINIGKKKVISGLHTFLLRGKVGIFSARFKGYLHANKIIKSQMNRLATGLKVYGVSKTNLKKILIPLPPTLAEQTAIATALSDMDALIEAQNRLIDKKRRIKQGAMQELLTGKRRLVKTEQNGYKQTEVGLIPEDWEVTKLGQILKRKPDYGINAASVPYNEDLPTYLRITDISESGRFLKEEKVSVDNLDSSKYFLNAGDLVFARTGASVGKTYLYNENDGPLVFAGFLIRVISEPKDLLPQYLKYWTQTRFYNDWISSNSARTGQPGINGDQYEKLPIFLPPTLTEQTAIATALSDMDTEIENLEAQLAKYRLVKQGMMQELLTGKTRLI